MDQDLAQLPARHEAAPAPPAPAPPAPASALGASAAAMGNAAFGAAVARVPLSVARNGPTPAAPAAPSAARGDAADAGKDDQAAVTDAMNAIGWEESVAEGPVGKEPGMPGAGDSEGQRSMFVGGKLTVRANLGALTPEQKALITAQVDAGGESPETAAAWKGDSYEWTSTFTTAGRMTVEYTLASEGATESNMVPLLVKADAATARANVQIAQSVLEQKMSAVQMKLGPAHTAYKAAYEKHKSVLEDAGAAEKLEQDVLIKIAFAAAGGAAGVAIPSPGDIAEKWATIKAFTYDTPGGRSTRALGAGAAAENKFTPLVGDAEDFFVRVHTAIAKEANAAYTNFIANLEGINKAVALGEKAFEGNPATVMKADKTLDELAAGLHASQPKYLHDMFKEWLERYAYKYVVTKEENAAKTGVVVGLGWKVEQKIKSVAASIGEDGDVWIEKYGGVAKQRARREQEWNENAGHPIKR